MKRTVIQTLALGGLAGPILFTLITLVCASMLSDYSHVHQFISELGATGAANAKLMNWLGFVPAGIMIALFGFSLFQMLPKSILPRLGSVLIIVFGIGMVVAGIYSCDQGCPREGTFENNIHDKVSGPAFLSAIAGILILGISFRKINFWRKFWIYSVVSAIASLGFLIGLVSTIESYTYTGMWQRLLLITIFLWLGRMAMHIFKNGSEAEK